MKKFLLDSFLFYSLFYIFTFILATYSYKEGSSGRSLEDSISDVFRYSSLFWVGIGPTAILISAFRNKTTVNKVYLIVIGLPWTLFLALLPYLYLIS